MDTSGKMMIFQLVHTTANTTLQKWLFFQKLFLKASLLLNVKWLGRHSSTLHKQQRRPLPSLLYKFVFYEEAVHKSS